MTPDEIREHREQMGLSQAGLAQALQMGPNGARRVREWEQGKRPISGPAETALGLLFMQIVGEQFDLSERLFPDPSAPGL